MQEVRFYFFLSGHSFGSSPLAGGGDAPDPDSHALGVRDSAIHQSPKMMLVSFLYSAMHCTRVVHFKKPLKLISSFT